MIGLGGEGDQADGCSLGWRLKAVVGFLFRLECARRFAVDVVLISLFFFLGGGEGRLAGLDVWMKAGLRGVYSWVELFWWMMVMWVGCWDIGGSCK